MHTSLRLSLAAAFGLWVTTVLPLDVTITILATENCGYANGKLQAVVSGGTPPYSYAWSNGSTQQIPTQLASGNYSVVVTDSQGEQGSANIFLPSGPFLDSDLGTTMHFQGLPYCAGMSPAGPLFNFNQPAWFMFAGVAPFTFDGAPGDAWDCDDVLAGYLVSLPGAQPGEVAEVAFLDANGCPGTITVDVPYEVEWPAIEASNVQAACGGLSNGSIQLAIGEEGHGQTVWMQVLDGNENVILGQGFTYTIGSSPINLTLNQLAPGTYTVVQHIITDECSPLFGQCTVQTEVELPEEADCPCLNDSQYPSQTFLITSMGEVQTVITCVFFGEYSRFGNVAPGRTYEFSVTGNGYITVRQGAADGPVLAQGYSPLLVTTTSQENIFVHYNADEECGTSEVCQTTTVRRILECEMPVAEFDAWMDCVSGLYHVTVNVISIGDAAGVDIVVLGEDAIYSGVGPGSYDLGPFSTLDMVGVGVVHGEDQECALAGPFPLVASPCPDPVVCGEEPLAETFCYANNEERDWTYMAVGEGTLSLQFLRGSIESSTWDQLRIYDGTDTSGTLLFEHAITSGGANLGPEGSAVLNATFSYQPVHVFSTTGALHMVLTSDETVGCSTNTSYDPWEWVVSCLDCTPPQGTATVSGLDCTEGEFSLAIEVTSTGDATTTNALYTVDGGAPQLMTGLESGTTTLGPFSAGSTVQVRLEHPDDAMCFAELGTLTGGADCPAYVVCGEPPMEESHCYLNDEYRYWRYEADGEGTLSLRFLRGTIESALFDRLRIYDGPDSLGPLLFEHDTSATINLGPEGSAILSTSAVYHSVDVFSSTGALFMTLTTDGSVGCASNTNYDAWEWEVVCGTVSLTGRALLDEDLDCTWNGVEPILPQTIIEVLPGPYYTTTSQTGQYFMMLNEGEYTIRQVNPYVVDHCAPTPQPFEVTADGIQVVIDFPDTAATGLDLAAAVSSGPARVGFIYQQAIAVQNLSAAPSGSITLSLEKDAIPDFVDAVPEPTTIVGNTLTWILPPLGAFAQHSVQVHYQIPADVGLIGTEVITSVLVTAAEDDIDMANNSTSHARTITAAYDPNDKLASTSSGSSPSQYILGLDEWIDYTIRFQNTGNDTAFTVVITDTLPSGLDPATIQMGAASHPFTWELKGQGILVFTFANILLPDSNINEPGSHGFVGFRIQPRLPLFAGDEIGNIANIYFDFNPPVITEPSVLVASMGAYVVEHQRNRALRLFPNPADQFLNIALSGSGALRHVEVRSIDGRLVAAARAQGHPFSLQIAQLASGTYSILATDVDGLIYRSSFIKH